MTLRPSPPAAPQRPFTHTEHGIHLDGHDSPEGREEGTRQIIETLATYLEG